MIVKIMSAAGSTFPGVNYNDSKVKNGKGELVMMKNFPSFIKTSSKKEEIKNYLKAISNRNANIKKPQFHAMISTKFQKHSKEELASIAENFMEGMGYGRQPYIVVFHKDTDHNHVHLVSTRVQKQTGKKINDSYEKLRSQKILSQVTEKLYGVNQEEKLQKLLSYQISSLKQFELLLERSGFALVKDRNDENQINILANGIKQKKITIQELKFDPLRNENRSQQLKAILSKYKEMYSNKVFAVVDNRKKDSTFQNEQWSEKEGSLNTKVEYESELQKKMRDIFGIDIVFHHKDNLKPFGYSLIDHKTNQVFKGSQILKLNDLFEMTSAKLDKKTFEVLKDYNVPDLMVKTILMEYLNKTFWRGEIKDFMLFENKGKKDVETYRKVQDEVKDFLFKPQSKIQNHNMKFLEAGHQKIYMIHTRYHYISDLKLLIGEIQFDRFLENGGLAALFKESSATGKSICGIKDAVNDVLFDLMKISGSTTDPFENDMKKKRKKRK